MYVHTTCVDLSTHMVRSCDVTHGFSPNLMVTR